MGNEDLNNIILQSMGDILLLHWDRVRGFQIVSDRSGLAWDASEVVDLDSLNDIIMPEDSATFQTFVNKVRSRMEGHTDLTYEGREDVSVRMKKQDGVYYYFNVECYILNDENNVISHMTIVLRELSSEEVYRIGLAKHITNDRNPEMFNKVSYEIMHRHPEKDYALIQFDVAKFKAINELYGEAFGDGMLDFFIESLKVLCDKEQLFVRLTADVFMILTSYRTEQDILDFIEVINTNLLGYNGITYRLVFGVCYVEDIDERLRRYGDGAAVARQSIKDNALQNIAFFEEGMKNPILNRKYLEDHMENALNNGEFVLYLQPKYSIDTKKVVGAEALVRWISEERGIVSPMEFIPLFEKNGFIMKMDAYIWEEACKLIRKWMDEGKRCVPISVNMSRSYLKEGNYLSILEQLIQKYQISKEYLEIEITESAEGEDVYDGIKKLKEQGYILLMDDFGSGYSSLNVLKDTQFDTIKIDRIFLQNFIESKRGKKIVQYIIRMSQSIGLDIVAEGVETKEQADFLYRCGCDVAQGFYYAKPMPIDEFNQLL